LHRTLGGHQSHSPTTWNTEKIIALAGNRSPVVQPLARHYTD
jgi:hypothetical protein